jgi:hypothetical protein
VVRLLPLQVVLKRLVDGLREREPGRSGSALRARFRRKKRRDKTASIMIDV